MLDRFFSLSPAAPYVVSAALIVIAAELGRLLGKRWVRRRPDAALFDMSTLEGASLGLLALMVSFTFSMTLARYDARLSAGVDEANAISTVALRTHLLPEPHATEVRGLLREYVQVRLDLNRAPATAASMDRAISRSSQLQNRMWQHALAASAADPRSIPNALFIESLNQMFDQQDVRVAAGRNRVPIPTVLMLYGIALAVIGFSGYVGGVTGKRGRVPIALIGVLVAVVIGMIGDFDRSRSGYVRVSQRAMEDVAAGLR